MVMSPMGLGTKNHCASEGQQQFSSQPVSQPVSQSVIVEQPTNIIHSVISQIVIVIFITMKTSNITQRWLCDPNYYIDSEIPIHYVQNCLIIYIFCWLNYLNKLVWLTRMLAEGMTAECITCKIVDIFRSKSCYVYFICWNILDEYHFHFLSYFSCNLKIGLAFTLL
jgi:hypothetical protein